MIEPQDKTRNIKNSWGSEYNFAVIKDQFFMPQLVFY